MLKKIALLIGAVLLLNYCTNLNDNPTRPVPEPLSAGSITLDMDMSAAPQNVAAIKGFLARADADTVFFTFEIQGEKAVARVENLLPGNWYLQVDAFDKDSTKCYSGHTTVLVRAGQTIPVYLQLNPVTGSLIIVVEWTNAHLPSILAYFPFEGDMEDLSPFHNHGQRFGNTVFSQGIQGLALELDGKTGYALIPHINAYNKDIYSIVFWFYKSDSTIEDTPGWDDVQGLIFKAYDTSKFRDFSILIGGQHSPFHLNFSIYDHGDSLIFLKVYQAISPRTWYHIAGIVNNHRMYLYLNGELLKEIAFGGTLYHSEAPITLGAVPPVERMIHRYFKGKIDEFAIFNGALSQRDIQNIILNGIKH